MPENRHLRFLLRLLYAALALAGLWLALRFLLPWLLPFLLAFGLAALLEPAVRLLMERLHLPRRGAAALCTAALTAAVLGGLALVVWRVGYELSLLLGRLPTLLAGCPRWPTAGALGLPVPHRPARSVPNPGPVMPWRAFWSRALPCPTAFMTPWPGR